MEGDLVQKIPLIALATPSARQPTWSYFMSIIRMIGATSGVGLSFMIEMGSLVTAARNFIIKDALNKEVDYLFWVDDDMAFPPDTLMRLLAHKKAIVAANCTTRRFPVLTTAWKGGERVSSAEKTGLEEVDTVGCGIMLTDMNVYRDVAEPWFDCPWNPKLTEMGEDRYFCNKARATGYPVWIDHDLSRTIGHVGEFEFNHTMVQNELQTRS